MKKKFAFVFPGQGSQATGMLDKWGDHPAVLEVLREASDALSQDMRALIAHGTKEELALTTNTQPVMLVVGVAAYRAWIAEAGISPALMAGHSLGEYSALVASGVLTLSQAAPLVRLRAQAMQEAAPVGVGAMAAILGLPADQVQLVCSQVSASFDPSSSEIVETANFNDNTQTVIAGSKAAVEKACNALKAVGARRTLSLPVSAPFHCQLMRPAAEKLKQALDTLLLQPPNIPVLNNVDVRLEFQSANIKDALCRQAYSAVRWVETIQAMQLDHGVEVIVECGFGKVLEGMSRRIAPQIVSASLFDPDSLSSLKNILLNA